MSDNIIKFNAHRATSALDELVLFRALSAPNKKAAIIWLKQQFLEAARFDSDFSDDQLIINLDSISDNVRKATANEIEVLQSEDSSCPDRHVYVLPKCGE